jgi:hypothetical protein
MKDDLSSPANATKYSYKVYEDGPLTYYHYYFEEIESPLSAVESNQPLAYPNKLLPTGLSAAGMLTAAFASGFAVVSMANQQPDVMAVPSIAKSQLKQTPQSKLSVAPAVTPEKVVVTPASLRPMATVKPVLKSIQSNVKSGAVKSTNGRSQPQARTQTKESMAHSAIAKPEVTMMQWQRPTSVRPQASRSVNQTTSMVAAAP